MKNIEKFLKPVLIVFLVASCLSCKNNKIEKTETEEAMPNDTATTVAVFEPFKVIGIKHKVADYDKWRKEYDSHDSMRMAYGISHYMIGRGIDDSNLIIIIDKINSEPNHSISKKDTFSGLAMLIDCASYIVFFSIFLYVLLSILSLTIKYLASNGTKIIALLDVLSLFFLAISRPVGLFDNRLWGFWIAIILLSTLTILDIYILTSYYQNQRKDCA